MRRVLIAVSAAVMVLGLPSSKLDAMVRCPTLTICEPNCGWDPDDICESYRPAYCYILEDSCGATNYCPDQEYQAVYTCHYENLF